MIKNKLIAAGMVTGTLLLCPTHIFADSISKVINMSQNQVENSVIGVITEATPEFATVEYKDSQGNIQSVKIVFENGRNTTLIKGDKVKVSNKDKWKFYATPEFISKLTDDSTVTSQHGTESQTVDIDSPKGSTKTYADFYDKLDAIANTVIGEITEIDPGFSAIDLAPGYVSVKGEDFEGKIHLVEIPIKNGVDKTYKKGDKVKVINKNKWEVNNINGNWESAPEEFLSKLTDDAKNTSQNSAESHTQVKNSVIGEITEAWPGYVSVKGEDSEGNIQSVEILFENGFNKTYKKGDKVKVINKDKWDFYNYGNLTSAPAEFLSKLTDESKGKY